MANKMIDKAIENCVCKIRKAQAAIRAFDIVMSDIYNDVPKMYGEEINNAQTLIRLKLHEKLAWYWNQLSWFAPLNEVAHELIKERTRSWFEQKNTEIMSFMGEHGSYYTDDEEKFREEVRKLFRIEE